MTEAEIVQSLILDPKSLVLLACTILNAIAGWVLLTRNTMISKRVQVYLAYATFFVAIWMLTSWINHFSQDPNIVTIFSRLAFASTIAVLPAITTFSRKYQGKNLPHWYFPVFAVLFFFILFTDLVILRGTVATLDRPEGLILGRGFTFFIGAAVLLAVYAGYSLLTAVKNTHGIKRERVKYIAFVLVLVILVTVVFNALAPIFGVQDYIYIGQFSTLIFAFGSLLTIIQESFFSIRFVLINLLANLAAGVMLFLLSSGTQRFEQLILGWDITNPLDIRIITTGILVGSLIATFIDRVIVKVKQFFFRVFKITYYSLDHLYQEFIEQTQTEMEIDVYVESFMEELALALNSSWISLSIYSPAKEYKYGESILGSNEKSEHFGGKETVLTNSAKRMGIALAIPLITRDEPFAHLFFGTKTNMSAYSKEEITSLNQIAKILSITVNRSLLYEEQVNTRKNLSKEIQKATKELQLKNDALELNLRKERDMLDILGHELRTPMSIVRNSVQMLMMFKEQNKLTSERLDKYLSISNENSVRLSKVLETIFTSTKIDNERLTLSFVDVEMKDVVEDALMGGDKKASVKGLILVKEIVTECHVYGDRDRIQEMVDNLVDNAVKYTKDGSVTMRLSADDTYGYLSVIDTGNGIKAEDIPKLGQKFFRTDTYLGKNHDNGIVRPGGTGLGLYVVFKLARYMDGELNVESKVGEGTTFTLKLPLYKGQPAIEGKNMSDIINDKFAAHQASLQQAGTLAVGSRENRT